MFTYLLTELFLIDWKKKSVFLFDIFILMILYIMQYLSSFFSSLPPPPPHPPHISCIWKWSVLFWYTFCELLFIDNIASTLRKKIMATHQCGCMILHSYANCNFCYCSDRIMVKMMMTCWEQPLRHHSKTLESSPLVFTADLTAEFCVLGICHHSVISMFKMRHGTFNKEANLVVVFKILVQLSV